MSAGSSRVLALCLALAACSRPPERPSPADATDVPAPQAVRAFDAPARDAPPARTTLRAPVTGSSADPPLREFDPAMAVPPWSGRGELTLSLPPADGEVSGALRAGDLSLRVRGFRAGGSVRGALEPESVDDAGAFVWRGMLDARVEGGALRGTWSASAHGGRYARAGTVGAR